MAPLEAVARSLGSDVDKKDTTWSDPSSVPPDLMIKDMIAALNDFAKLSLTPSFKAPKYKKEDFPVHSFDITDHAHTLDENIHR